MKISTISVFAPAASLLLALAATAPARATTWVSSGLGGGGTQNCAAIDPNNDSIVISAADISGIQRSTDGGKSWIGVNLGTGSGGAQKVASVAWSNIGTDTVYAGCGDNGSGGGLFVSTDGGVHWSTSTNGPQPSFSGNGSSLRWPRDTGNLILSDPFGSGYIYVGSANNGVMRSTDGGQTWTGIGLNAYEITGLAWDPGHPAHIYVTTRGNNTWWTSTARGMAGGTGTTGWTQMNGPAFAEEALVVGTNLYVTGATTDHGGAYDQGGGIWETSVVPEPGSLSQIGGSTVPSGTTYTGLAGSADGAVLFIGQGNPTASSNSPTLLRSTDGGSTFTAVSLTGNVNFTIFDGSGAQFWEDKSGGPSGYLLGHGSCAVSQIAIDPTNNAKLIMAGRSGLWGTQNGTAGASSVAWYPYDGGYTASSTGAGGGISVTEGTTSATDPNHAGRAYYGMGDFGFVWSTDGGGSWQDNDPSGGGSMVRGIWVDPVSSTVYTGKKGDNGDTTPSNVFSSANPTIDGWTAVGGSSHPLNSYLSSGDEEFGVGGMRDSSGNAYIFACVANTTGSSHAGLWRYNPTAGTWSNVASGINPNTGDNPLVTFGWTPGDTNIFVYEQSTGLWRGSNLGASGSWTKIWGTTSNSVGTGVVVADPSKKGTLYVSTTSGVYRFDGADSGSTVSPRVTFKLTSNFSPGPLAISGGTLYCCGIANSSVNGSLISWANAVSATGSTTPSTLSDSVNYPGQSNWPDCLSVDPNGRIVIAERDEGMMLGK